jgi:hypothetical protein
VKNTMMPGVVSRYGSGDDVGLAMLPPNRLTPDYVQRLRRPAQ